MVLYNPGAHPLVVKAGLKLIEEKMARGIPPTITMEDAERIFKDVMALEAQEGLKNTPSPAATPARIKDAVRHYNENGKIPKFGELTGLLSRGPISTGDAESLIVEHLMKNLGIVDEKPAADSTPDALLQPFDFKERFKNDEREARGKPVKSREEFLKDIKEGYKKLREK